MECAEEQITMLAITNARIADVGGDVEEEKTEEREKDGLSTWSILKAIWKPHPMRFFSLGSDAGYKDWQARAR